VRVLAVLILLVAIGLLGLFAWPLIHPEAVPGSPGSRQEPSRTQRVGLAVDAESEPEPGVEPEVSESSGPLCDRLYDAQTARPLALPTVREFSPGPPARPNSWTFVNLWAAWCKPCKEEMPLLSSWASEMRARGASLRVIFLSLDDDERQLERYLKSASLAGKVVWAYETTSRERFLLAAGLPESPTLPVQLILDPLGRLRCVRVGSIGPKELDEATTLFKW